MIFLEIFERERAQQTVQHDHGDEQHVQEQTSEYFPRIVHERRAPVRRVVEIDVHQHGIACGTAIRAAQGRRIRTIANDGPKKETIFF